jgi:hypothetical protein
MLLLLMRESKRTAATTVQLLHRVVPYVYTACAHKAISASL